MNDQFVVYTDITSLFDMRAGILQKLLGDRAKFKDVYTKYGSRIIDDFIKPEFGITNEDFNAAFDERTISDFQYFYPTNLLTSIFPIIMDVEQLTGMPINIKAVNLTVNMWPFEPDQELLDEFRDNITKTLRYKHSLNIISSPNDDLRLSYFKQFTHVFKYDLLGRTSKNFMNNADATQIPGTKFLVPALKVKEDDKVAGTAEELIMKVAVVLSAHLTLIPINPHIFDSKYS